MNTHDEYYARVDEELCALEGRDGIIGVKTLGWAFVGAIIAVIVTVVVVVF